MVRFDDAESLHHVLIPHSIDLTHTRRRTPVTQPDDHLSVVPDHMHVRWPVLPGWQVDPDREAILLEYGGHAAVVT